MVCVKPEKSQNVRRMAMRAGLELFAKHCQLFSDYIIKGEKFRLDGNSEYSEAPSAPGGITGP